MKVFVAVIVGMLIAGIIGALPGGEGHPIFQAMVALAIGITAGIVAYCDMRR